MATIDAAGFSGRYDFFYLPIDFKNCCNVGYAFINMATTDVRAALHVHAMLRVGSSSGSHRLAPCTLHVGIVPLGFLCVCVCVSDAIACWQIMAARSSTSRPPLCAHVYMSKGVSLLSEVSTDCWRCWQPTALRAQPADAPCTAQVALGICPKPPSVREAGGWSVVVVSSTARLPTFLLSACGGTRQHQFERRCHRAIVSI
jgi:RNA recognition motif 2